MSSEGERFPMQPTLATGIHAPSGRGDPSSDSAWMRMRTPSPENTYSARGGLSPPPLPQSLLQLAPALVPQPYVACAPVLCLVAVVPCDNCRGADDETTVGGSPRQSSLSVGDLSSSSSDGVVADDPEVEVCEEFEPEAAAKHAASKGSVGHPHSCAAACKYVQKPRGCKDGKDCARCHLCDFRTVARAQRRRASFGSLTWAP